MPILIEKIEAEPEVPHSLILYEAFRLRLFEFAFEELFEPADISEMLMQNGIGESLLFAFLTYLHLVNDH